MLLVLAAVAGWPLLRLHLVRLHRCDLADLSIAQFIGFANFEYLLTDPDWWTAVRNTMVFTSARSPSRPSWASASPWR